MDSLDDEFMDLEKITIDKQLVNKWSWSKTSFQRQRKWVSSRDGHRSKSLVGKILEVLLRCSCQEDISLMSSHRTQESELHTTVNFTFPSICVHCYREDWCPGSHSKQRSTVRQGAGRLEVSRESMWVSFIKCMFCLLSVRLVQSVPLCLYFPF